MAENKQYITQVQAGGNVMISEDVISTIVANAVAEVEGVVGLSTKPGADMMDIISKKAWGKSLKISIGEDDLVYIDCNLIIGYGHSVVNVAKAVQESVTAALESIAGVTVASVNVNVTGIERK